uniref:PX domain-containing protein n=1 Tax=Phytophthora ramorum TaxID=164328 RepID=H3HB06_PHYRM
MKIGIKGGKGEREVQSEPFDISAVGVRGQILVPTNRSRDARSLLSTIAEFGAPSDGLKSTFNQYEFGVMIEQVGNFVLRVKSKVRPAPPCLPECFEGNVSQRNQLDEDEESGMFFDEEDEYSDAERMLAEGIQLNVAVELHDPSFLKTLVKDDKGNVTIGFEGGEPVLPFHTIDYVPFRFSAFPTVFVQVQKVAGLGIGALRKEHPLHGHRPNKLNSKSIIDREDSDTPVTALSRAATVGQAQVVASFEVQLKKLQRLPTIDVSEGVAKKRLWAEVLLDETTKTLLVTDMLPGFSGTIRQGGGVGTKPPMMEEEKEAEALALSVRFVDATYLEDVFLQAGRSDLTSCQPFITFSLKTEVLSALMLNDKSESKDESSSSGLGANAEIIVEIREADKILFGSSIIANAHIPLQEYCAAAMISARGETNYEPQVVEFLAPVRVARKDGGLSRPTENETRIRFQMCCQRTLMTRSAAASASGEGIESLETVKELVDLLSAYQLKKELNVLGKIRIGDTVVAANNKSIVNLHRDASFAVIEKAMHWGEGVDTAVRKYDAEWNRRVEFVETADTKPVAGSGDDQVLVPECWVPLPPSTLSSSSNPISMDGNPMAEPSALAFNERISSAAGPQQPQELSYGQISDGKHVINARVGHFQIDNQLLDTNYPVLLRPMRLLDAQMQEEGYGMAGDKGGKSNAAGVQPESPMLLPTLQLMAVFCRQSNVIQFDYIFGQLQELEIKLEDATLVALAHVFSGGRLGSTRNGGGANMKVLLRWLLLCPVKVNVTFTSTADRSLLLSLLSPDMSSVLSTLISAAAALVSNLDKAPIRVPEFYVENLLETTHTLAFYAMQHYLHHGLRSWYSIMGSVDFLGNPIGLVSTLGTGVKDFFYTPAQMLLEDENGLRIDNLRTGMTKGSKSLLRNTAVGIFHTTGKITETLGKGIALLAMDEQYNVQRQRASTRQIKKINDLGDAIAEGSKGLVGGVWDGIKGVVAAPVRGAEQDGAGGFVVGIGKGVAGLIVKPTAGFLDLLTSLSRGAKTSAESLDGTDRNAFDTVTRFRLPRRICSDGVLVSYSERESRGYAVLLLTSLDATDDYVYHVDYGIEPHRGLLLLTDKRLICLSGKTGQKLWEVALDSTLEVVVGSTTLKIGQSTSPSRSYNIECDDEVAATNFRVAVDSARVDVSATRYLLLNLEKSQEESRNAGGGRFGSGATGLMNNDEDRTDLHVLMENVQDTTVSGVSNDDLRSQPLRSVRVEVCHLQNKDAHANVPDRAIDKLLSFSVFQIQVYGGPYQWTVFRRFSEFRELCAKLEAAGYAIDGLPSLPPRTFLPSTRAPVAKHRQEALNMFLQAAIMHSVISRSAAMLDFLTREAHEVRVSLPPLSPTGEREASQRAGDSP